jgi:uncharacterized protein (TIGR03083 family)
MPMHLEVLRGECRRISTVVDALPEESFAERTRLPAWTIKDLLAHLYIELEATIDGLAEFPPAAVHADSVSYWSYDATVESEPIADAAKALAATFGSGADLAAAWDRVWRAVVEVATSHEDSRPIRSGASAMTLNEFLKTRILEVTVHGLDLAATLGRPAWATPRGLAITTDILIARLGVPPPSSLGWDDLMFVEKGTGRQPLSQQDGAILGELSSLFPLLR